MSPLPVFGEQDGDTPGIEVKSKPTGVIIPPPDIRSNLYPIGLKKKEIADKTAEYVAKNGSAFEEIVMKSESNNPKFSFLKLTDPYRAYYDQKIVEFAKGLGKSDYWFSNHLAQPEIEQSKQIPISTVPITQKKDFKKEIRKEVKPPKPDRFSVKVPANITVFDADIIKLTAQFVAKNGQSFLISLTEREKQNPHFDFLKPTHQYFTLFTNLVDAYSKTINPSKVNQKSQEQYEQDDVLKLQFNITDKMSILNRAAERFEYDLQTQQAKKKKEELDEEERSKLTFPSSSLVQMAQIDWNDFVVVETIELHENEELPAPADFSKVEKPTPGPELDFTKKSIVDPSNLTSQLQPSSIPLNVLSQFQPKHEPEDKKKEAKPKPKEVATNKCPICSQYIAVSEFNEHLRIEMLDPKYKEIKEEVTARAKDTTTAAGDLIAQNLQSFASKRPDLFGEVEGPKEDRTKGIDKIKKINLVEQKIIWDGQSTMMSRTSATHAMIAQQHVRNYEEPYKAFKAEEEQKKKMEEAEAQYPIYQLQRALQKQEGNFPQKLQLQATKGKPVVQAGPQLPQKKMVSEADEDGSHGITKKVKTEEASLIPEATWLMMNPVINKENIQSQGQLTLNVKVSALEADGKSVKPQLQQLKFEPRATVAAIKEALSKALGGFSTSRMRLKTINHPNLKDEKSIAFYNLLNGTMIELVQQ